MHLRRTPNGEKFPICRSRFQRVPLSRIGPRSSCGISGWSCVIELRDRNYHTCLYWLGRLEWTVGLRDMASRAKGWERPLWLGNAETPHHSSFGTRLLHDRKAQAQTERADREMVRVALHSIATTNDSNRAIFNCGDEWGSVADPRCRAATATTGRLWQVEYDCRSFVV